MYRKQLVRLLAVLAIAGCDPAYLRGPWEGPAPEGDISGDPLVLVARVGFGFMVLGGVAGAMWYQASEARKKAGTETIEWQERAWPVAIIGFGVGLPIYVVSNVLAEQRLDEERRKHLSLTAEDRP